MVQKEYMYGDEVEILNLFKLCFKRELSLDYWKWRFIQNPFLESPMINLMWDGNLLVGHYAVSASEILYEDKQYLTSLSGTTMTHPAYEGKNIFTNLSLSLYNRISEQYGINCVLGFPNQYSHYGLVKKIGWKDIAILPTLKIRSDDIKNVNVEGDLHLIDNFSDYHTTFIHDIIKGLHFEVFTSRTAKHLNWRYLSCPTVKYFCFEYYVNNSLNGIIVMKEYPTANGLDLDIVEIFCISDICVLRSLIYLAKEFIEQTKKIRTQFVNCWMSIHDSRHLELEKLGFRISTPLTYMCVKPLVLNTDKIVSANKWYISMGDSDVY